MGGRPGAKHFPKVGGDQYRYITLLGYEECRRALEEECLYDEANDKTLVRGFYTWVSAPE